MNGSQRPVESIRSAVVSALEIPDPVVQYTTHDSINTEPIIPQVSLNAVGSLGSLCEPFVPNSNQSVVAGQLGCPPVEVSILLDSGASDNFISQGFVDTNVVSTIQFKKPRQITLFDGKPSSAGPLREYVEDTLVLGDVKSIAKFNVTLLSGVDIVLGYSWLQENGAVLDFEKLTISQRGAACSPSMVTKVAVSPAEAATEVVSTIAASLNKIKDGFESNSNIETLKAVSNKRVQFQDSKSKASMPNAIPVGMPTKWNATVSSTRLCAVLDSTGDNHDMDDIHALPSFDERWELTEDEVAAISKQVPPEYMEYIDLFHP